jgi:Polyphosphate kinase 2 (PPK2)
MRHVRVSQFAAPSPDEARHRYLWRFWPKLPGWGGMAVFDRSGYGRVLAERVEGYATPEQWQRAYGEIVEFERTLDAEGMVLIKFFLHISEEEQLRRSSSAVTTRSRPGSSPPRTGRTGASAPSIRRRSRTCWPAPTMTPRRGAWSRPRARSTRA